MKLFWATLSNVYNIQSSDLYQHKLTLFYYTHFEITGGPYNLIYSQIAPFFALNHIFFQANEEATLKTKQPVRFQGLFNRSNCWSNCRKNERQGYHVANFATFVSKTLSFSPQKMDELNFRPVPYCINKIIELTKSCIWAISKWM